MQNAIGNETSVAPMYEKNANQLHPQVHTANNPTPTSSKYSELLRNDPYVVFPLGNVPPNFIATANGNVLSSSSTFLNNSLIGNAPNASDIGNAQNNNGNAPIPPHWSILNLQENFRWLER